MVGTTEGDKIAQDLLRRGKRMGLDFEVDVTNPMWTQVLLMALDIEIHHHDQHMAAQRLRI